jgi:shikimate dehydrogenase
MEIVRIAEGAAVEVLQDLIRSGDDARIGAGERVLIGLVGRGIQSSLSPTMHEREGARLGLRYSYLRIDFDQLGLPDSALAQIISEAERAGFAGLNVTHPFKQSVIPHLSRLASEASAIGAVNTIVFKNGLRHGHNTDSWGFAESFRDGMAGCRLDRVVQFGAGGAGAAVAYALMELGVGELSIVDTDADRSRLLAERMATQFGGRVQASTDVDGELAKADGIVNTTPVGMAKYPGVPFSPALLAGHHWVAEIIYFPQETELLKRARALGCRTLAGTGMAVYQAVRAFEFFTGIAPDRAAMVGYFEAAS